MQTSAAHPYEQPMAATGAAVPAEAPVVTGANGETHVVHAGMGEKEAARLKKELEKEGKHEDSLIKKQIKEISSAEKAERKAEKADEKALKKHAKTVEEEHKANKELERAQANRDKVLREEQQLEHEVQIKKEHHAKITQNLQQAKAELDELTRNREAHANARHDQLNKLDAIINHGKA